MLRIVWMVGGYADGVCMKQVVLLDGWRGTQEVKVVRRDWNKEG